MGARRQKIALFGGSFDPIHTGHLILAQAAINAVGLARVLFVPTALPPHKRDAPLAGIEDRLRMVALAIEGNPRFELSRAEARRRVSYTIDTVRSFADGGYRKSELHLLVGSDSLEEMGGWREPGEIFSLATIVVMMRPGHERVPPLPPEAAVIVLTAGASAIASRSIRALARQRRSIRYLVPDAVERFIAKHSLYASKA
jgi:nicotinate-nucleotide adenylyltransferase